jgi:hypothetical protein
VADVSQKVKLVWCLLVMGHDKRKSIAWIWRANGVAIGVLKKE